MARNRTIRAFTLTLAVVLSALAAAPAHADSEAAQAFERGEALLKQSQLEQAREAFERAVALDNAKQEYREAAAILRRVIQIREHLERENNQDRWVRMARSLRSYYLDKGALDEALKVDRELHRRLGTLESAAFLAQTHLELGQDQAARALLEQHEQLATLPEAQLLLGIAHARTGQHDEATRLAGQVELPQTATPDQRVLAARLHALLGDAPRALAMLTAAFEATPPSRLAAAKAAVKACPDFGQLDGEPSFARVLTTDSKVSESSCSSGSSCGACPSRSSCGKTSSAASEMQ